MGKYRAVSFRLACAAAFLSLLATAARSDPIRIGYGAVGGAYAPLWMAQEEGYFARHGLETETVYIPGGSIVAQALLAGDLQLAVTGASASLRAAQNGADLKLIANTLNAMDFLLVGKPEIAALKGLQGKRIAVTRFGGNTDLAVELVLARAGLKRGRDVTVLQTGGMPQMLAALTNGSVDAAVMNTPLGLAAVRTGFRLLLDFGELNLPYAFGTVIAREAYLKSNRNSTLRFLRAYAEAMQRMRKDRATAMRIISKYTRLTDPELLASLYALYEGRYLKNFRVDPDAVRNLLRLEARERRAEEEPARFIDNSFVVELEREGVFQNP